MSSSSLSFGPAWMRPKPSKSASQEGNKLNESPSVWLQQQQQQQQQQPAPLEQHGTVLPNKINKVYTADELLKIWTKIQDTLQEKGFESKYQSLDPIRQLVQQVEVDRALQLQQNRTKRDNPQVVEELAAQLNSITNWTAEEQSALDINSIIKNAQQSQSPFNSQAALLSSLNMDRAFTTGHAPLAAHFSNSQSFLLQPSQVNWFYLDPQGNQQGPFDGSMMDSWHQSGYLSDDLQLKREDEYTFYTLKELKTSLGTQTPFAVPLQQSSNVSSMAAAPQFNTAAPPLQHSSSTSNFQFDSWSSNTFVSPQPQLPQQTWNSIAPTSGRSSPWVQQPQLTQDFGLSSQSPFLGNSLLNQSFNTGFSSHQDDLFNNIQSHVLNQVLDEPAAPGPAPAPGQAFEEQKQKDVPGSTQEHDAVDTITGPVEQLQTKEPSKEEKKPKEKKKDVLKRGKEPRETRVKVLESAQETGVQGQGQIPAPAPVAQTKPVKPALAPWANKASTPTAPKLTLDQIQQLEAEESKRQLKLKAEKEKLLATQLLASTEKKIKEETTKVPGLPLNSSWGQTSTPSTPTKTLLDIQREEAEAAERARKLAQAQAQAQSQASPIANIVKPALPTKNSFASIANSTSNTNSWTTVAASKKPVSKPSSAPKVTTFSNKINPDVLRTVSATSTPVTPMTNQGKGGSPRQEFLAWCRTSMKLNNGVNTNDVLQILLMLPVGQESAEIIADTIYSNSSTMDGRRFAQEFMKRRSKVETQVNDGLSWNDALHITVGDDDDDGWDFQVVGKKTKRRN